MSGRCWIGGDDVRKQRASTSPSFPVPTSLSKSGTSAPVITTQRSPLAVFWEKESATHLDISAVTGRGRIVGYKSSMVLMDSSACRVEQW